MPKPKREMRDSFTRFGDDLCELLLSYLGTRERFGCECVCKQWQRLVFNRITKLVVGVTGSWVSQETRPVNVTALEVALRKCVFIADIEVNVNPNNKSEVLFLIVKYWHKLSAFKASFDDLSEPILRDFCLRFGPNLRKIAFNSDHIYNNIVLKSCPNIDFLDMTELKDTTETLDDLGPISGNQIKHISIKNMLLLQTACVKKLSKIFDKNSDSLRSLEVTGVDNNPYATANTNSSCDHSIVAAFFGSVGHSKNLKKVVINWMIVIDSNVTNPLRELCDKCANIEILVLRIDCTGDKSLDSVFRAINCLKQLKGLTININGTHWDGNELMIRSQQLTDCRQLRRLTMRFVQQNREFSGQFFVDIGQHLPRLQHLNINDIDLSGNHTVPALGQLKHLRSINMSSLLRLTAKQSHDFVLPMVSLCPRITYIVLCQRIGYNHDEIRQIRHQLSFQQMASSQLLSYIYHRKLSYADCYCLNLK